MRVYECDCEYLYFTGDIHGAFDLVASTIKKSGLENCGIVFCGDIGIGFEKEEYYTNKFNRFIKPLTKNNVHLFFLRGNHDDKSYFDGEHFNNYSHIHVIPDYSVIKTPTRNVLCVGGAISIDRKIRLQEEEIQAIKYMKYHNCSWDKALAEGKKYYWPDENIVFDEDSLSEIDSAGIRLDTICTHTAPTFCQPITKNGIEGWLRIDPSLSEELDAERQTCDKILSWCKEHGHPISNWYYGHFHFANVEIIDGVKYNLLDMCKNNKMEIKE